MRSLLTWSLLAALVPASSAKPNGALEYHDLKARQQNLPSIKLPYGTWQASKYDSTNDLYVFKNIRFAAPATGPLRFAKPAPPTPIEGLQTGAYGPACAQSVPISMLAGNGILGTIAGALGSLVDLGTLASQAKETGEDCLFLDVFVPGKALKGDVKLPIVNWIYGGAYLMGSKEGNYDGTPIIKASGGNVVYVAGNYRVGALGWLAGSTMEKEGAPNAGLWDQRAVLEWIKSYGSLFGGDTANVSVWGESAGAGSITHHLTAFGGKKESLFKRAVIQSAAFDPQVDRKGQLEKQFQDFATFAGCAGKGMSCLRAVDLKTIKDAQDKYIKTMPGGKPGFGPATDGDLVRQLPVLELASGNIAPGIESIINSHVIDEAAMFTPSTVDDATINAVLDQYFGTSPATKSAIITKYSTISNAKARIKSLYQFATFTCSNRFISEGFPGKTYNLQYARGSGIHGSDIAADFYIPKSGFDISSLTDRTFGTFATTFQSYLLSHARTGNPSTLREKGSIEWPLVTMGSTLTGVMNATNNGFELIADEKTREEDCGFWKDVLAGMTSSMGYAPPGAVVQSSLVKAAVNPSANF